jgi:hypothetical protein
MEAWEPYLVCWLDILVEEMRRLAIEDAGG